MTLTAGPVYVGYRLLPGASDEGKALANLFKTSGKTVAKIAPRLTMLVILDAAFAEKEVIRQLRDLDGRYIICANQQRRCLERLAGEIRPEEWSATGVDARRGWAESGVALMRHQPEGWDATHTVVVRRWRQEDELEGTWRYSFLYTDRTSAVLPKGQIKQHGFASYTHPDKTLVAWPAAKGPRSFSRERQSPDWHVRQSRTEIGPSRMKPRLRGRLFEPSQSGDWRSQETRCNTSAKIQELIRMRVTCGCCTRPTGPGKHLQGMVDGSGRTPPDVGATVSTRREVMCCLQAIVANVHTVMSCRVMAKEDRGIRHWRFVRDYIRLAGRVVTAAGRTLVVHLAGADITARARRLWLEAYAATARI